MQSHKESPLLLNLSFVFDKPTGISTYATNLFPYLQSLEPTLLVSNKNNNYPNYQCYPIPRQFNSRARENGTFTSPPLDSISIAEDIR